jgi:hypothetical protein
VGLSAIAPNFWQTAEQIKIEAIQRTAQQNWPAHSTIPSAICLYHTALDCFMNEEIALAIALTEGNGALIEAGHAIQDLTLCEKKLDRFFSFFGLEGKQTPEVRRRTSLFIGLRDRLYHHSPEARDVREHPDQVIAASNDAGIEPVNTSWAGQCMHVGLAVWASTAARAFIDDWCRAGNIPSRMQQAGWELQSPKPRQGTFEAIRLWIRENVFIAFPAVFYMGLVMGWLLRLVW